MSKNRAFRCLLFSVLALATLLNTGCVNLDARPATAVTKAPIQKTPEAMVKATKATGNSWTKRIKRALPKPKSKIEIPDKIIADDDPTRLDSTQEVGPDLYVAAARLSERNGRYDTALEQYNTALKTDGKNRNALIGLARLQHKTGNLDAAIGIYRDALNIYRNDAVMMNDLGMCYARNGQINESISMLQMATETAPDREMYLNNLAAALVEADRMGEAVAHLARLSGPAMANYKVGYLLDRAGRKSEAEAYLTQALAIDPNMRQARAILDANSPRMSSLPNDIRYRAPNNYEIPVTQNTQQLQLPKNDARTEGTLAPASPDVNPPNHLKSSPRRFGPFGYTPKPMIDGGVQVVSYVEDVADVTDADEVE